MPFENLRIVIRVYLEPPFEAFIYTPKRTIAAWTERLPFWLNKNMAIDITLSLFLGYLSGVISKENSIGTPLFNTICQWLFELGT
ncbi:uncharacterized protein LAJ45_00446 [Morchella importuna]|uniref:uncharacterized protein n=1 Tax=Morchella importuna TaxID=1174673 RepID=UPI001E8EB8F6|nr:uncharacterized protein LAJ45_00446 [Morchella importuna]KAH8155436.1 hypothetical protein LAJ45_00446 [Morchella importuna]